MNTKKNNGYTLVEIIVTLVIVVILAGIIFAIYLTQAREIAISSSYASINRGYDLFFEQFSRDIRYATSAIPLQEINEGDPRYSSIQLVSNDWKIRYILNSDVLCRDSVNIGENFPEPPIQFSTGANNTLTVDEVTEDGEYSYFTLENQVGTSFKEITSHLILTGFDGENEISFPRRKDFFKCRN